MRVEKLKTKTTTMVCMSLTKIICECWKFCRCKTPFRNVSDFDYHIWDLRSTCPNSLVYQAQVQSLPFYMKIRTVDKHTDTVTNEIKIGDMGLEYSFEHYIKKGSVPLALQEPPSAMIKRELLKKTLSSHKPIEVVDLEKVKIAKQRKRGSYESRPSK